MNSEKKTWYCLQRRSKYPRLIMTERSIFTALVIVFLLVSSSNALQNSIRLLHGVTPNQGFIQLQQANSNLTLTVCSQKWSEKESVVTCRMLGMRSEASSWFNLKAFNSVQKRRNPIFISGFQCNGSEDSLFDCGYRIHSWCFRPFLEIVGISCGYPSVRVDYSNVTSQSSIAEGSSPLLALDEDPSKCFHSKMEKNPWIELKLRKEAYIHTLTVFLEKEDNITEKKVEPVVTLYDSITGDAIACNVTSRKYRKHTVRCNLEFKTDAVRVGVFEDNVSLSLCRLDVFAFDSWKDARGVLNERWNHYITPNESPILKFNSLLAKPPDISQGLPTFEFKHFPSTPHGDTVRQSGFLMVSVQGEYTIGVSECNQKCEVWLRRVEEPGIDEKGGSDELIIKVKSITISDDPKTMPSDKKKVLMNPCMLYHMEVYMTSPWDGRLVIVYTTPNDTKPQAIPSSMLYSVRPGVRDLQFDVENISTRVELGSTFAIKASYKFCCRGLICPACPVVLKLLSFGKTVTVNERLEMDCLTYNWTYEFEMDAQPGNYSVEIIYSLEGDLRDSPQRRRVIHSVEVTAPVVYRCDFHDGLCDGWETSPETPAWSPASSSKFSGLHESQNSFIAVIEPGEALLHSRQLPWKPIYKKINFCVGFSYLLPTNATSRLEVSSQSQSSISEKLLRWVVSGYHGTTWRRARIPVKSDEAFKVTFKGISTVNGTIGLAVRDFQFNAGYCELLPVFALPGFRCKSNQFQCVNGQCVDKTYRCNGILDGCLDGSDETGCICRSNYFTCSDGTCIKYSQLCNGIKDCGNGEDDNHCEMKCPGFQCFDGTCGSESCASNDTCEDGLSLYNNNVIDGKSCVNSQSRRSDSSHCKSFKGLCGFENGPCGLEQNPNSSLQWIFFTPAESLNKQEVLPSHDHTTMTSKGTYFVLKSHATSAVRSSSLHRNWIKTGQVCMHFWYFISDKSDSLLEIVFETLTSSHLLWKTSNSTSYDWAFGQVQIPGSSPGKLIVQGHVKQGFVALDDLGFEEGLCSTIYIQENPSCYFGIGEKCRWYLEEGWTPTSTRLPSMSKLYNIQDAGDSFLLLSSPSNRTVIMSSPLIDPKAEGWRCLRFWFYSGKKYLRRKLALEFLTENRTTEAWSYSSTTDKWTFVQLPIPWEVEHLRVVIKGTIQDRGGFLAIDDITFLKEQCRKIPVLGNECQEYDVLDGTDRRSDKTLQRLNGDLPLCDELNERKWYRFAGAAGNQMEDFCKKHKNSPMANHIRSCSKFHDYKGWVNGTLPSVEQGIVEKQLCFIETQCCDEQTVVRVRNCDSFYVYQFPKKLPVCQRYCTKYKQETLHFNETSEWKDWVHLSSHTRWSLASDERINDAEQSIQNNSGYSQGHGFDYDLGVRFWGMTPLPPVQFRRSLTEMTLCLWAHVNSSVPIFLKMVYIYDRIVPYINISSYRPVKWKHICVTWKSNFGLWQTYIDGILRDHGKGALDKQLIQNILFMSFQSTSAVDVEIKLTRLNIWNRVKSAHEIRYMSYQCVQEDGNSLRWSDFIQTIQISWIFSRYNSTCKASQENVLSVITNSSHNSRSFATIESPRYERSSDSPARCLKFRFRIWGPGARSLKIYQELDDKEYNKRPIWMVKDSEDSRWRGGQVTLLAAAAYKVIIEGLISNAPGLLSIKGLYTNEGYCGAVPTIARKACNEIMTNQTGYVMSTYYPGFYDNNVNCTWTIKANRGHVIRLEFKTFELELSPRCSADYVEVYDGELPLPKSRIGRYCGVRYPLSVQSTSNTMLVTFKSNDKTTRSGFKLFYKTVKEIKDDGCIQDCPSDCYCQRTWTGNGIILSSTKLQSVPDRLPRETSAILFSGNKIHQIEANSFYDLPSSSFIDLSYNTIFKVKERSFLTLPSLKILRLNANFIKELHGTVFDKLTSLKALDLSENLLTAIENSTFSSLFNLQFLGLYSNRLRELKSMTFANNSKLLHLYLHNNLLESIPTGLFRQQKALKTLKLHSNKIKSLDKSSFKGLAVLRKLTLHDNPLKEQHVSKDAFAPLVNLRNLTLDSFILCCYATKLNPNLNCESPGNELSSCDDMLKTSAFRYGIWLQGILASLGNVAVILWWSRFAKQTKKKTKGEKQDVQSALFSNLACADFLMGVYLLFLAVHDTLWMGEYFHHDVEWRSGLGCKIAGVISTLSSEVSVMILVFVTADRMNSILFYFSPVRFTLRMTRVICSLIWLTSSLLAVAPILIPSYFNDKVSGFSFYGRSTVCLPLQLSTARPAGWEYSVGIFVLFNGAAFLFILLGYLAIFIKVRQSARRMRSARSSKRPFGKRMLFIVLTDFCTWMPVVVLSALSLTGHFNDSSGKVYALIAVYVIPLNSSLNPILYTFSTEETRKKLKKEFCKWVSKFSKSDSISVNNSSRRTRETYFGLSLRRLFSRSSSSSTSSAPPNRNQGIELLKITRNGNSKNNKNGSTKTDQS